MADKSVDFEPVVETFVLLLVEVPDFLVFDVFQL